MCLLGVPETHIRRTILLTTFNQELSRPLVIKMNGRRLLAHFVASTCGRTTHLRNVLAAFECLQMKRESHSGCGSFSPAQKSIENSPLRRQNEMARSLFTHFRSTTIDSRKK